MHQITQIALIFIYFKLFSVKLVEFDADLRNTSINGVTPTIMIFYDTTEYVKLTIIGMKILMKR